MSRFKVIHGDMTEVLSRPEHVGRNDLVFADAPFNIGHPYQGYSDNLTEPDFRSLLTKWAKCCWNAVSAAGVMALHGNDYMATRYLSVAESQGWHRIAWVIWHYRFGQHQDANWITSHCHCLIYAKDPKKHTWNPDAVLVESDRSSVYADDRVAKSARRGMRVPLDVWGVPSDGPGWGRVQGNSKERRTGHPNQLPERYLKRLILAYTNPGDRVLDPFCGTGTTATVAVSLGREAVTIDISEASCASARERIRKGMVAT